MILVPNLQRLLSGNKLWLPLFCLILVLSSCDGFKKAQGTKTNDNAQLDPISTKKRKNPKTGEYEVVTRVTEEMENVQWKDDNSKPPITSTGIDYGGNTSTTDTPSTTDTNSNTDNNTDNSTTEEPPSSMNYSTYNVAVMLPFMSDQFNVNNGRIYEKSKTAINFYGGMELAFQELERDGLNLNVSVLDTKGSVAETGNLLNRSDVFNAHLIIGPVRKDNVKKVAEFAKKNKKVLVSPLSPSSNLSPNNPYYVQVSPSFQSHCDAITKHVLDNYDADQVVLVVRNKGAETRRLQNFHDANAKIQGSSYTNKFKELIVPDVAAEFNNLDPTSYFHPTKKTVFIIPSWSSETFINSMLRVIRIAKNANIESTKEAVVYGMPKWQDYQKISFDYYEDLNVHISSSYYIDPTTSYTKDFRQRYFNQFGTIPDHNAYIGYDIMKYFGKLLNEHGDQFQFKLDQSSEQYLHTKFDILPTAPSSFTAGSEQYNINQFENSHVNILQFKNFYFQLAN